jgi:putative ABC transport system substrate-binding protein
MKKNLFLISIALISAIALCVFIAQYFHNQEHHINDQMIAIITPVTHPSLEKAQQGFIETLTKKSTQKYHFTIYNANGSEILLRSQVAAALASNAALIYTIGAHATKLTQQTAQKKGATIPIVFTCVARPVDLGIIPTEQNPGPNITGIIEANDYEQQINFLLQAKPMTRNILLVYNPAQGAGLLKDKEQLATILINKKIHLQCLEVFQTNEVYSKTAALIEKSDVLLILKDNTVVPALDSLIKLCTKNNVTLYASDLDSVAKGAALGFGVNEYDFGIRAAEKALLMLQHQHNIPAEPLMNFKCMVNTKTMIYQGLKPHQYLMKLISTGTCG